MLFWHVPAPDEALLISGSKHKDGATQEAKARIDPPVPGSRPADT